MVVRSFLSDPSHVQILLESPQLFGIDIKKIVKVSLQDTAPTEESVHLGLQTLREILFKKFVSEWIAARGVDLHAQDERIILCFFDETSETVMDLNADTWKVLIRQSKKRITITVQDD